jgi:hypothetical protein
MASNKRKRIFPKPPKPLYYGKLEKGTAEDIGKRSNKTCPLANAKAIYNQQTTSKDKLDNRQAKQLQKLRANLARRIYGKQGTAASKIERIGN